MTLEEFNNLKKGDKLYYFSVNTSTIYEYKLLKRIDNKWKSVITRTKINHTFYFWDLSRRNFFKFEDLVKKLKLLNKTELVKILKNQDNKDVVDLIEIDFIEYLI